MTAATTKEVKMLGFEEYAWPTLDNKKHGKE